MSSTNKTTNYKLPQWVGTDHPSFSEDFNPAFSTIDTTMKSIDDKATTASSTAATASETAEDAATKATAASAAVEGKKRMTCDDFDNLFITNINKE